MRRIFPLAATVLTLGSLALWAAPGVPGEKETVRLEKGTIGAVLFLHSPHLALEGMTCEKCHGGPDRKGRYRPCIPCHESRRVRMTLADTYHGFCRECHRKEEWEAAGAPVLCRGCHTPLP